MDACNTSIEKYNLEYKWTIRGFSDYFDICTDDDRLLLMSPFIYTGRSDSRRRWCIKIYLNGSSLNEKQWISIHLYYLSGNKPTVKTRCKYSILDCNGSKREISVHQQCFTQNSCIYNNDNFYKKEDLFKRAEELMPNNQLTIIFDLLTIEESVTTVGSTSLKLPKNNQVVEGIKQLFELEGHGDVMLVVGNEEFEASKAILMAHSPVFFAMFKYKLKEQKENRVDITDVKPEVFRELLRFIYTDNVLNINEIAEDLLVAADKYALDRLKVICEEALCDTINLKNMAKLYFFADRYNAEGLKEYVVKFIDSHTTDKMYSLTLKALEESCPYS